MEARSELALGSAAEELDRWEACLAATALASLSCNLSLADLEGVVERGGGVDDMGVEEATVDEGAVAEATEEGRIVDVADVADVAAVAAVADVADG